MRLLFFIAALFSCALAQGEIYKWVDGEGSVHYGDQPETSTARPVRNLPQLSTYAPAPAPALEKQEAAPQDTPDAGAGSPQASAQGYRSISIVSPENGGTVRSSPGNVPVFIALAPVLHDGDYMKVILDGKTGSKKYRKTAITLNNVSRGEHRIAVAVYAKDGKKLLQSETLTFFLHRTIGKRTKKDPPPAPDGSPDEPYSPPPPGDYHPPGPSGYGPPPPPSYSPSPKS